MSDFEAGNRSDGSQSRQRIQYVPPPSTLSRYAPQNPNFVPRKAWPEDKFTIKLPQRQLPPGMHRFKAPRSPVADRNGNYSDPQGYADAGGGSAFDDRQLPASVPSSRGRDIGPSESLLRNEEGGGNLFSAMIAQLEDQSPGRAAEADEHWQRQDVRPAAEAAYGGQSHGGAFDGEFARGSGGGHRSHQPRTSRAITYSRPAAAAAEQPEKQPPKQTARQRGFRRAEAALEELWGGESEAAQLTASTICSIKDPERRAGELGGFEWCVRDRAAQTGDPAVKAEILHLLDIAEGHIEPDSLRRGSSGAIGGGLLNPANLSPPQQVNHSGSFDRRGGQAPLYAGFPADTAQEAVASPRSFSPPISFSGSRIVTAEPAFGSTGGGGRGQFGGGGSRGGNAGRGKSPYSKGGRNGGRDSHGGSGRDTGGRFGGGHEGGRDSSGKFGGGGRDGGRFSGGRGGKPFDKKQRFDKKQPFAKKRPAPADDSHTAQPAKKQAVPISIEQKLAMSLDSLSAQKRPVAAGSSKQPAAAPPAAKKKQARSTPAAGVAPAAQSDKPSKHQPIKFSL